MTLELGPPGIKVLDADTPSHTPAAGDEGIKDIDNIEYESESGDFLSL
jgi:hypothetical protein